MLLLENVTATAFNLVNHDIDVSEEPTATGLLHLDVEAVNTQARVRCIFQQLELLPVWRETEDLAQL